jgi:hypothetical protein
VPPGRRPEGPLAPPLLCLRIRNTRRAYDSKRSSTASTARQGIKARSRCVRRGRASPERSPFCATPAGGPPCAGRPARAVRRGVALRCCVQVSRARRARGTPGHPHRAARAGPPAPGHPHRATRAGPPAPGHPAVLRIGKQSKGGGGVPGAARCGGGCDVCPQGYPQDRGVGGKCRRGVSGCCAWQTPSMSRRWVGGLAGIRLRGWCGGHAGSPGSASGRWPGSRRCPRRRSVGWSRGR